MLDRRTFRSKLGRFAPVAVVPAALVLAGLTVHACYDNNLESAIATDMSGLDLDKSVTLKGLLGLANGTRQTFIGRSP